MQTKGHVALFLSLLVFTVGVLSSITARMHDKQDSWRLLNASEARGLQSETLLQNSATILNEPIAAIRARRSELLSYTSLWHQSPFMNTLKKVHPVYAPFASTRLNISRLLRISAYLLQINLTLLAIITVFSSHVATQTESVEFNEIQKVFYVSVVMSVMLLPVVSEPIIWAFDTPAKGEISTCARIIFIAVS